MKQNEKSIAANDALKKLTEPTETNSKENRFVMNNDKPNQPNFQPPTIADAEFERMRRREMLESTRLSCLPSLPNRNSHLTNQPIERTSGTEEMPPLFDDVEREKMLAFGDAGMPSLFGDIAMPRPESFTQNAAPPPVFDDVCAGCNAWLDLDDQIQQAFSGCRDCLSIYSRLDAAFDENSKRRKKEILEKMAGGAR